MFLNNQQKMRLNNYWYAIIMLALIAIGELWYIQHQNNEMSQREQDNLVHLGKDQVYRDLADQEHKHAMALEFIIHRDDSMRALHKNDEQIILTKYEPKINGIKYLHADSSIKLLAKYLSANGGSK